MWRRIRFLAIKELLAVLRDRRTRLILIVPPILQLIIFTFAMTQEVRNLSVGVLDQDLGQPSRELVSRFEGATYFTHVSALKGYAEIAPALDGMRDIAVIVIGQDFSRDIAAGKPAQIQILLDGRRSNAAQLVEGYAETIVTQYGADLALSRDMPAPPSVLVARSWFNPNLESRWATVPGLIGALTMLIGLLLTGLSVARERELGTFEQLLVSPLAPHEILLGKALPALAIGMVEATMILGVAVIFLSVPFVGSLWLLYAGMAVYMLSVIGVGLFISSLVETQQQAILGAFTFYAPAFLLSGFVTPIENMPRWLQWVTWGNPVRFFLAISKGVFLKNMNLAEVAANLLPMALIAFATLGCAAWLFGRRVQ